MSKKNEEVVDAEFVEVESEDTREGSTEEPVKCELRIGMEQDGKIYFNILGSDQSLVLIDGLIDYAKREIDKIWETRLQNKTQQ